MEGFTYHNIFETKGIEYLVIIAFFGLLIPFWIILARRRRPVQRVVHKSLSPSALSIPGGLLFAPTHTWVHLDSRGRAKVGIDDLVMSATGVAELSELPKGGEIVKKGEKLVTLVNDGRRIEVMAPVSGRVDSINEEVAADPALLAADPTGDGWLVKIIPSEWRGETSGYWLGNEAGNWFGEELSRLKDFIAESASKLQGHHIPVMQDGGEMIETPLKEMPAETWKEFTEKFLTGS